jgi:hypothetical protein
MKRRSFFHLLWGAPAVMLLHKGPTTDTAPAASDDSGPPHECVDRPELPCPACAKWTGDPLAIQDSGLRKRRVV